MRINKRRGKYFAQRGNMLTLDQAYNTTTPEPLPSQTFTFEPEALGTQVLIIDDSNHISSLLVSNIFSQCSEVNRTVHVVQSGTLGLLTTVPLSFSDEPSGEVLTIYTASSPKNALPVLRLNAIHNLTIVSDIMMPADTEVGLFGLLREIAERGIQVNLVFISSEGQNRYYVQQLIDAGKAFFVEKGSDAWVQLPYALVRHSEMFQYKTVLRSDYDRGVINASMPLKPVSFSKKRSWWQKLAFWQVSKAS